jgi:Ni/Fe-hydrogenase subunit HybB-like protein
VRATILTAFLGYLLVVSALMFDIGRPWAMWHPLVMWNPHSVMFEVSWCVTLYTTVLFLEFSGMVFEKLKWQRAVKVQHAITVPCVVAGVLLSTLHQSSLGTVYLIVPGKLHALWYTQALPLLFWISSVSAGLAMLIFESRLSSKAFGRQLEMPILSEAGRVLAAVLGVYGALRVYDLGVRGMFGQALDFSYESRMFLLEFVVGLVVPFVMLLRAKVRSSPKWLYTAAVLTIVGFVTNRLNVSITGFEGAQGGHYLPSVGETLITIFFVALGFGAFALAVRHLDIYPETEEKHGARTGSERTGANAPAEREKVPVAAAVLAATPAHLT